MITQEQIDTFVAQLQTAQVAHYQEAFPNLKVPIMSAEVGRKYVKIVKTDSQTSVFCFLDRATGDILKAAGWNAPAKGARGHIRNGVSELTPYGAQYKIMGGTLGLGLLKNPEEETA